MTRAGMLTLIAGITLIAAACGASTGDSGSTETSSAATSQPEVTSSTAIETTTSTTVAEQTADGALPAGPSALDELESPDFPDPLVPVDEIIHGGPPPDGIPPIESPVFLDVADASDLLEAEEAVVALEIDGDARAYPVRVMIWHEIVNDTVGGVPVSITYCPLCNSAISYRREINGVETTFGTSGRLYASALVMYDRATESLWTHFDGRAVVGLLAGEELEPVASPLMAWEDFQASYPDGEVLDWNETGFQRSYGSNPYVGYDDDRTQPFLFRGIVDDRAAAKQRVVGITVDDESVAYSLAVLADGDLNATNTTIADQDLVILWKAGQSSALDESSVGDGRDVGSAAVFVPVADGRPLTIGVQDGAFVDEETGSTWTIAGVAADGPLEGTRLERVEHLDTFWFAWSTYQPETTLIDG